MPRLDFTDITILLDRSGSMLSRRNDVIGGFNSFIAEQRKLPGKVVVSLIQFDDHYEPNYTAIPLAEAPSLEYAPRGSTALLDAMGRAINETGARLAAMPEGDRPGIVIFVVMTDGLENASHEFTSAKVFEMISHQRECYNWQFTFIGANQDAIASAASFGIPAASAMSYNASAVGTQNAYAGLSAAVGRTRVFGVGGQCVPVGYDDDERQASMK